MKFRRTETIVLVAMAIVMCLTLVGAGGVVLYVTSRPAMPVATAVAVATSIPTAAVQSTNISSFPATWTPVPTLTPEPPTDTPTAGPTLTPVASPTPRPPTKTPTRAPTSTPEFQPQTQKIGPILDSTHDSEYSVEITLKGIKWLTVDQYDKPKPGNIYVIVDLGIKNLGPGELRSLGLYDFQVKDAKGAVRDYTMLASFYETCQIETVDLVADGSSEGCASFEVPEKGKVELIYAPFKYEGLKPGRYISFLLRKN